jgi:leucyl/phenylalanyl-tRNA--protein transferase
MITRLGADPTSPFPNLEDALDQPDGLLAWGGDLAPARLVNAYQQGIFPWYSDDQPILWWCPSQRCVIRPQEVHVSRRLQRALRQKRFRITADQAFAQVVSGCALPRPGQDSTWITPEMSRAYLAMHHLGHAHSIEVWLDKHLVGGIYGLAFGRIFFGESMFSRVTDASKIALVSLCRGLQAWNFTLLDCQLSNPHLLSMGATQISRQQFCRYLQDNPENPARVGSWTESFLPAASD